MATTSAPTATSVLDTTEGTASGPESGQEDGEPGGEPGRCALLLQRSWGEYLSKVL